MPQRVKDTPKKASVEKKKYKNSLWVVYLNNSRFQLNLLSEHLFVKSVKSGRTFIK